MNQIVLVAIVLGLLAAMIVVQERDAIKSAVVPQGGAQSSSIIDHFRHYIPGTGTLIIGDVIWFFFKWIIIPLVLLLLAYIFVSLVPGFWKVGALVGFVMLGYFLYFV